MSFATRRILAKTLPKPQRMATWAEISDKFDLVNLATKKLKEILETCEDNRIVMQAIQYAIDRMYGRAAQSVLVHETSKQGADWADIMASIDDSIDVTPMDSGIQSDSKDNSI